MTTFATRTVLAVIALQLASCAAPDADPGAHNGAPVTHELAGAAHAGMDHDGVGHRMARSAEPSDFSIYHAGSTWTDQTGTERELASLAGRVQVVAMLYTSCAYACPRIMLDLKRIEGELGSELGDDVGFVVVSIDPDRDTPERLAEFAAGSRLDPATWTLLTSDEEAILEMAALLGVQYRQTEPGEWVHSNVLTVLDPAGEVVHRQEGLGTDPAESLRVIRALTGA